MIYRIIICILLVFKLSATEAQLLTQTENKVTINLGWHHQFQFAGYYAALEKGYFAEEGLDVSFYAGVSDDNIDPVISGKFPYGVATGGVLLEDERYKQITVVAAILQQSPVSLITLNSNGIRSLKDLEGKDIIGGTEIRAMLSSADVDLSKVKIHGRNSDFYGLIEGKIDASSFFITDQVMLLGNDSLMFSIFRPIEYGINFYGECLFTSRQEVTKNPERVEKVRRAVIRGWQYAVDHPEEIIDLIINDYNPELEKEILMGEANVIIHRLILPTFYDIGDMQQSKWQAMADLLIDLELIVEARELDSFMYLPPGAAPKSLKTALRITLLVIIVIVGVLLVLLLYNRQLKKAVDARTLSLEKANEEMDRFVYSISHDIRSPLSSIQGLINLIKLEPERYNQYIELIDSSIVKLDNYTRDILDYTRNSRAKVEPKIIHFDEIVEKCISQVKYMVDSDKVDFTISIDLDKEFSTDPWRLEVILTNLIANAIKYSDEEKEKQWVGISIKLKKNRLLVEIDDNGIGIDHHHQDKIFNMFYRASEDSQGSGLGLYIVKETVNLLGGKISLESTKHKGTLVSVEIPKQSNAS